MCYPGLTMSSAAEDPPPSRRLAALLGRSVDPQAVDAALAAAVDAAAAQWPGLALSPAPLLPTLAALLADEADVAAGLARLALPELLLCAACLARSSEALDALDAAYLRPLSGAIARLGLTSAEVDDALQRTRQELLLPGAGAPPSPPALARYQGRGPLRAYVRVVALRAARKVRERERGEVEADEPILDALPDRGEDPEVELLKRRYQEDLRAAFREALAQLAPEDRLLLKQHLLDGLGIDHLARLHGVHRATAARWLARAREGLAGDTRRRFLARVPLAASSYQSVLHLIYSQLDLSLRGHLGAPERPGRSSEE